MNSIVYKPLITREDLAADITSGLNISNNSSSPRFKYTGYKPQYNWRAPVESSTETTTAPETAIVQEDPEVNQQIEWEDPSTINWGTTPATVTSVETQQQSITTPVQHVFKTPDIDTGEMKEFLDVLADAGIAVRVTSGVRPGAKTSSGNTSWHSQGRALDITPVSGTTREDFNKLKDQILNAPTVIKYMQDHNIGILDETLDETLQKTGGSGWHFHIGPDQSALKGLQAWLNDANHLAKHGMKFSILAKQGTKLPVILAAKGTNIPRKQQKLYDRVTERLTQQAYNQNKNISPITGLKYEEPLQPLGQEIASFLPGVGDVIEVGNIVNDIKNKNYLPAILGTTLFLLPGNIPQIVRKLPEGTKNAIKIETFLPERLETGAIKRTHLPEKVNNKPIQEAMLDVPIEIGDSKGKAALYDFDNNKIILDKNLKESLYPEVIPHEWSHWLDYQSNNMFNQLGTSGFMMVPEKYLKNYKSDYFNPNIIGLKATTEVGPRLTQILDNLGIKDGNKILNWDEWKDAIDDYIKKYPNTNIELLKDSIKDEYLFTKWAETNAK